MYLRNDTNDSDVWNEIVHLNSYQVPTLQPYDLVIDIGGHIGSFAYKAHEMGSRRIFSFEADLDNHITAVRNLTGLPGVHLIHSAVVRSDIPCGPMYHSGYATTQDGRKNAGSGHIFAPASAGERVPTVSFDDILGPDLGFERVRLLKLDCEGSEWPILYTTKLLHRIDTIVGEYHTLSPEIESTLGLKAACRPDDLAYFLELNGFTKIVFTKPTDTLLDAQYSQQVGQFRAER